jgi:hypothetical protein
MLVEKVEYLWCFEFLFPRVAIEQVKMRVSSRAMDLSRESG